MAERLEDYAFVSDSQSAALISRQGSIDWLCFPRFDSAACLAALIGRPDNGHWSLAPTDGFRSRRYYSPGTLVLTTIHETEGGSVSVTDALIADERHHRLVRLVDGISGTVAMATKLVIRFDYGSIVPWVRTEGNATFATGGPDAIVLHTPVARRGEGLTTVAEFEVAAGERVPFELAWYQSTDAPPEPLDVDEAVGATIAWWRGWSTHLKYDGAYKREVHESLTVLKGLTHQVTGAIVAAPTTSLPEWIGAGRNWDYRYCWLRDATFTLLTLVKSGCIKEATSWRDWLVRAVAGDPSQVQIMYGIGGERRIPESELGWLDGYEDSRPVRVGNGASHQVQLDVFGEVMDALHHARRNGMEPDENAWQIQCEMLRWLSKNWRSPDSGIWEVRGPPAQFTHSKIMAWVAFDRGVLAVEEAGLIGDVDGWRAQRDAVRAEILANAVTPEGVFTRTYGSADLDAANLMIPLVGFLPPDDPRVIATIEAIQARLTVDGLVQRYDPHDSEDGVGGEEGSFLLCSFWLVDCLALIGRREEAVELFERLLKLRNDVGLLSEEYHSPSKRMLGNFPQAFSHVALVSSAMSLCSSHVGPSEKRSSQQPVQETLV